MSAGGGLGLDDLPVPPRKPLKPDGSVAASDSRLVPYLPASEGPVADTAPVTAISKFEYRGS